MAIMDFNGYWEASDGSCIDVNMKGNVTVTSVEHKSKINLRIQNGKGNLDGKLTLTGTSNWFQKQNLICTKMTQNVAISIGF